MNQKHKFTEPDFFGGMGEKLAAMTFSFSDFLLSKRGLYVFVSQRCFH